MSNDLPPEFDPEFYLQCKPYLTGASEELLEREFRELGIRSGSPGSPLCYRKNILKYLRKRGGAILEIGPGCRPDFRRDKGDNVKYLDVFTAEEMREKFVAQEEPPKIDYLLEELTAGNIHETFDLVYSAHNFEHQINPVLHIMDVGKILKPGGLFVAVIPDKNFTFDHFRELSTLTDILSSPPSQTVHSLRTHLLCYNRTHNNCVVHWIGNHGAPKNTDEAVITKYTSERDTEFRSLHVHVFEPDSFRHIFGLLSTKNIIPLQLMRVYNTPFACNEFVAVFCNAKGEHKE